MLLLGLLKSLSLCSLPFIPLYRFYAHIKVYKGRLQSQSGTGKEVAVKVIHPSLQVRIEAFKQTGREHHCMHHHGSCNGPSSLQEEIDADIAIVRKAVHGLEALVPSCKWFNLSARFAKIRIYVYLCIYGCMYVCIFDAIEVHIYACPCLHVYHVCACILSVFFSVDQANFSISLVQQR